LEEARRKILWKILLTNEQQLLTGKEVAFTKKNWDKSGYGPLAPKEMLKGGKNICGMRKKG